MHVRTGLYYRKLYNKETERSDVRPYWSVLP
jgi:hypothetical protein